MSNDIIIRYFQPTDFEQLLPLFQDLGYEANQTSLQKRLKIILEHPDYELLVACHGQNILGFLGYTQMYFFEADGKYIRILALVTSQHHRRKGIASLLIDQVEKIAKESGCSALALNSGIHEERVGAHRFYEKLGFEKASYGFKRKVNLIGEMD